MTGTKGHSCSYHRQRWDRHLQCKRRKNIGKQLSNQLIFLKTDILRLINAIGEFLYHTESECKSFHRFIELSLHLGEINRRLLQIADKFLFFRGIHIGIFRADPGFFQEIHDGIIQGLHAVFFSCLHS